jgi:hypothetical protein
MKKILFSIPYGSSALFSNKPIIGRLLRIGKYQLSSQTK